MVDFPHLYMYSGGFSLIKFFFGDDDNKNDNKNDKKEKKGKNDAKNKKKE